MTTIKKSLGLFALTMINVIAVTSLRTLPVSAEYGLSLIFYYVIGGLVFFIPISFVCAELATAWPDRGGLYIWIREAFGKKWGFLITWLQWIYNVVWYPTVLVFVVETMAYLFFPDKHSNTFTLLIVLTLFWGATLLNLFGMRFSSAISTLTATLGTLVPMVAIMICGVAWVIKGYPTVIEFNWSTFFPNSDHKTELAFFTAIVFGLTGMEMSAAHADEVEKPEENFPKSIFHATILVFITTVGASLAIAMVVPKETLNLVTGLTQAFGEFFRYFHLKWAESLMGWLVSLGSLGTVTAWIIGPTKGLLVAAQDGSAPHFFARTNRYNVPSTLLITQAVIFTVLCSVFILMPTIESAYWVLTTVTAQMCLVVYIAIFLAAIKLRLYETKPRREHSYQIPGGNQVLIGMGAVGIIGCLLGIGFGFIPPPSISLKSVPIFEVLLVLGMILISLPPFIIYRFSHHGKASRSR